MSAPRIWTDAENALIAAMRSNRAHWDVIAERIGVHRTTLIYHAKQIGLWTPEFQETAVERETRRDWWPLPAGADVTWLAISNEPWPGP